MSNQRLLLKIITGTVLAAAIGFKIIVQHGSLLLQITSDLVLVLVLLGIGEVMIGHVLAWSTSQLKTFSSFNLLNRFRMKQSFFYHVKRSFAVMAVILLLPRTPASGQDKVSPEAAIQRLKEGNQRFVTGTSARPHQDYVRLKEVATIQKPFATILGCSDSRVPNEIIFDQGLGDLFIVRTAGQVSTTASWGSIEFAEEVLGTQLIVVLGHTRCGAVNAAVTRQEVPGHIVTLINAIKPAVEKVKDKDPNEILDAAIRENVRMQVEQLKGLEPVLAKRIREQSIRIVGALYDLNTGKIEFFE